MYKKFHLKSFKTFFHLGLLFIAYRILHSLFYHITHNLDHSLYKHSDSFFISAFSNMAFLIFFLTVFSYLSLQYKKISWKEFDNQKVLRIFILIMAFPLFWEHGFSDYNYYLDTDNNIDRILIFIVFLLIYIHPIFVFIFLTIGFVIWNFITFPFLAETHWHDVRPAYEILILFVALLVLKTTNKFKNISINIFILLALTIHASNYFIPGTGKIEISPHGWEWGLLDNTNNLLISSYINGWLCFLSEDIVLDIAYYLDKIDFLLTIPTLLIQVLAIFLLINKRVTLWFFILFEALHFGIAFAGGILFWTWIIVNIGFIYLIKNMDKESVSIIYSKKIFFTFIVIVMLSPILYKPTVLAWWDTAMHTTYDIYVTTDENKTRKLNTLDLSPYNTMFAQESFAYTSKDLTLVPYNYGFIIRDLHKYSNFSLLVANFKCDNCLKKRIESYKNDSYELYLSLENAQSVKELKNIIHQKGESLYDERKKEILRDFLYTYFKNFNKRGRGEPFYKKFGAPYHQYDFSSKRLNGNEKINKVEVIKSYVWYNKVKRKIIYFDKKNVMTIKVK